jgi:hypothetical protein
MRARRKELAAAATGAMQAPQINPAAFSMLFTA